VFGGVAHLCAIASVYASLNEFIINGENMRNASIAFSILFGTVAAAHGQSVSIADGSSFHRAVVGQKYGVLEGDPATVDNGGVLYVFVQNADDEPDGIDSITVYNGVGEMVVPDGWLVWPPVMDDSNGQMSTVTIKGVEAPLAEGEAVSVVVHSINGARDSIFIPALETPAVRLANAIPSQDGETLFLYLRNDGDEYADVQGVFINDQWFDVTTDGTFSSLDESMGLDPGEMGIYDITAALDLSRTAPLAIRLQYVVGGIFNGQTHWVSAGIRVVSPDLPIGSWHSSGLNPENEEGRKRLRRIGVEMLHGPGNPNFMADGFQRYHISTIREPNFGDPFDANLPANEIANLGQQGFIKVWSVDDEPDLNSKPIDEQLLKAKAYRDNDPTTNTYVNLAVQKKYQRYGYYTDIVGMDHYAAPSAPNVIPLTNVPVVGRMSEAEEALEYSDVLKWNTEPRRNWSWVQLAGSVWDHQAHPAAINYQFWAHFMAGAKGLEYFVAQSNTANNFPEQWNEGVTCFKEWKQIRNLCLYGEPVLTGTVTSNEDALARTLVGPEGMVVIVLNNTVRFTGNSLTGFNTLFDPVSYNVEFDMPEWLTGVSAYMLTDSTRIPVNMQQLGNGRVRITPPAQLNARSHVFVIGLEDTEAPNAIEGLNVAEYIDSANYTFSWKEPWDNVGVQGYNVYFNNVLVDRTHAPIYELKDQALACSGYWKFAAYDNSGNIGPADSVLLVLSGGEEPVIVEQPLWQHSIETLDDTVTISVQVEGFAGFQWQYLSPPFYEGEEWVNISPFDFNGATSSSFTTRVNQLPLEWSEVTPESIEFHFRCIVSDPCGDVLISETSIISGFASSISEIPVGQLLFYPNPTQDGRFTILMPEHLRSGELTVHSTLGQLVHRSAVSGQQSHITLDLPVSSGLYTVRIASENGLWHGKVAVSK
jgi:hypothetical protein